MATKTGPPRTRFGNQKWSEGKLWQPKPVPPGPVLAAKSGLRANYGNQNRSPQDPFWQPKVVQVQVLAAKSGLGRSSFGNYMTSCILLEIEGLQPVQNVCASAW